MWVFESNQYQIFFSEILMARKWRPVSFSRVRINHKNVLPRGLDGLVKISSNFNYFLISYYSEFFKINSKYFQLRKSLFNLHRGFGIGFSVPIFIPKICHFLISNFGFLNVGIWFKAFGVFFRARNSHFWIFGF